MIFSLFKHHKKIELLTEILKDLAEKQIKDLIDGVKREKSKLNFDYEKKYNCKVIDDSSFKASTKSSLSGGGKPEELAIILLDLIDAVDKKPNPPTSEVEKNK